MAVSSRFREEWRKASWLTWIGLWVLTGSSIAVGVAGLIISLDTARDKESYQVECLRLHKENSSLRMQLVEMQPAEKTVEMVVSVSGGEFAPRTLAQQNRNFANVKSLKNGQVWEGQIGTDKFGHAIFKHPAYSIRACALVLKSYERRHGIRTVKDLVYRFAEGNREPYIKHLCEVLDVEPEEKISLTRRLPELLRGIVRFETGLSIGEEHLSLVAALR